MLATCPTEKLPAAGVMPVIHVRPAPAPTATRAATQGATSGAGRLFADCDAVRAARLAPPRRGSADYAANPQLDRGNDGLACER